jgi:hypothetical protein
VSYNHSSTSSITNPSTHITSHHSPSNHYYFYSLLFISRRRSREDPSYIHPHRIGFSSPTFPSSCISLFLSRKHADIHQIHHPLIHIQHIVIFNLTKTLVYPPRTPDCSPHPTEAQPTQLSSRSKGPSKEGSPTPHLPPNLGRVS